MDAKTKKKLFERLRNTVYVDKKPVYFSEIVDEFQLKTVVVNDILEKFVKNEKARNAPISVSYVLSGIKNDGGDDINLLRFVIVDDDELEERKKYFTELIGTQIRSISPKNDDDESSYTFSRKATLPQDLESLRRDQKLSGITNKLIKLRLTRLNKLKENGWIPDENSSSPKPPECKNEDTDFTKLSNSNKKVKLELKAEEDDCDKVHSTNHKNNKATVELESKVKEENNGSIKENSKDKNEDLNGIGNQKKKIKLELNVKDVEEKNEKNVKNTSINGKTESKPKVQNTNKGKKPLKSNQKVRLITDMFVRKEKPEVN